MYYTVEFEGEHVCAHVGSAAVLLSGNFLARGIVSSAISARVEVLITNFPPRSTNSPARESAL